MKRSHQTIFAIFSIVGAFGFAELIDRIFKYYHHQSLISASTLGVLFLVGEFWLLHEILQEAQIPDKERAIVERHRRKKESVILRNHPLLESPEDTHGIQNMDELDRYFDRYEDEVSEMDWDKNGNYIFKEHKYIQR